MSMVVAPGAGAREGSADRRRVVDALNRALHHLMEADPQLAILGEDLVDPYGGAFKVTAGLSTAHPGRVVSTPISEAAITGVAIGRAMAGLPTVVEIMFGDFVTLSVDQLVNHAAKLPWLSGGRVEVPLVLRTPMGGRRGYGPTHSQSLEKLLCGVPGLDVVAVHQFADPAALLIDAVEARRPTVVIENKVLYARPVRPLPEPARSPDLAIVAYGGMVEHAVVAAERLREEELGVRVVAVERLWPFPDHEVRSGVGGAPLVMVVEEGTPGYGFGAECARALIAGGHRDVRFVTGPDHAIPASRAFERRVLPDADRLVAEALDLYLGGGEVRR